MLVHCFAGKSRASTITLSYLILELGLPLKEALLHLKKRRPIAQPNSGFMAQLVKLEFDILGSNSDITGFQQARMGGEKSELKELKDGLEVLAK